MAADDDSTTTQPASRVTGESSKSDERPAVRQVDLDDVLRRRSRRQRLAGIGVTCLAALVVAALVLHASGARITLPRTPTPQRPVGVALVSNISFGTLTLNGRRLGGPPPQAVTLRGGTNVIVLTAPPFAVRQCVVSWPSLAVLGGRCTVSVGFFPESDPALDVEYALVLDYDGRDLPPDAAAAARATLDAAIGAVRLQTTVPSGQRVATGWTPRTGAIASMVVTQPTQAQLDFAPAAGDASCPADLCAGPEFIPGFVGREVPGGAAWMLSVGVSYTWRFVTSSGAPMASVTYPSDATGDIAIAPDSIGDGGWHIWQPVPPASNSEPQAALAGTLCDWPSVFRVALPGVPSPANVGTQVGLGIEGCAFTLQTLDGAPAGTLVWRFGVLLAADDLAHARFPALPLAAPGELGAIGGSGS